MKPVLRELVMKEKSNSDNDLSMKWSARQRLRFIEVTAYFAGSIRNQDLAQAFDVSSPMATKDLRLYRDMAPGNLVMDTMIQGYRAADAFRPVVTDLDPAAALNALAVLNMPGFESLRGVAPGGVAAEHLELPARLPPREVVAVVARAIREKAPIEVQYFSVTESTPSITRVIEPRTMVHDGLRWHVRAYDVDKARFADFALARIEGARRIGGLRTGPALDPDWEGMITVELMPHPALGQRARKAVEMDFAMGAEGLHVPVRRALAGYLLIRLGVDTTREHRLDPRRHQLALVNRDEVAAVAGWAVED